MCQGDGGQYMGRNGHQWRPSRIREISDGRWPGLSYWWWKVEWIYVCGCTPRIHGIGFYLPTCTIKINYIDVCKYTWIPWIMLCFFFCIAFWLESLTWCFFGSMIYCTCFFLAMRFGLVSCDFCQELCCVCTCMFWLRVLTWSFFSATRKMWMIWWFNLQVLNRWIDSVHQRAEIHGVPNNYHKKDQSWCW